MLYRELACTGPTGVILSTDDYFANQDGYTYDPSLLPIAHQWNHNRGKGFKYEGRFNARQKIIYKSTRKYQAIPAMLSHYGTCYATVFANHVFIPFIFYANLTFMTGGIQIV